MKTSSPDLKDVAIGFSRSKVIWLNMIAALLPVLDYAQVQLPLLNGLIPREVYVGAYVFVILANIVLRFATTKALEDK